MYTNLFEHRHWIIHDLRLLSGAKKCLLILLLDSSVTPNLIFTILPFSYSKTLVYFFVESSSLTVLCGEQYSGITVSDLFQVVSVLLFTQGQTFLRVFKEETGVHQKAAFSVIKLSTY